MAVNKLDVSETMMVSFRNHQTNKTINLITDVFDIRFDVKIPVVKMILGFNYDLPKDSTYDIIILATNDPCMHKAWSPGSLGNWFIRFNFLNCNVEDTNPLSFTGFIEFLKRNFGIPIRD